MVDDRFFSTLTIDSTTANEHENTLSTVTNDLEINTGAYTNLYCGQIEEAFGLFGNFIDTDNINANISGSHCDHKSCVDDELLSNCDTGDSSDNEDTYSNCDTCLVGDESIMIDGVNSNSLSLDFVNPNLTWQPFVLKIAMKV